MSKKEIALSFPLKQGDKKIEKITIRKPMAGELRGIKILDILQMDVTAYVSLLPRIATPALSEGQVYSLDLIDMMEVMTTVQGFFIKDASPGT